MTEFVAIPIVGIPLVIALALAAATRGVCYYTGNTKTDNEKMICMAREIRFLSWPSRMHSISYGRGQLREYYVLALKLFMKITGMKATDHAIIVLALVSNAISSILVFYIGRHYFGDLPGLFVLLMYVSCVWPYHVAIGTGHVLTSQALFLLSVLALILATDLPTASSLPLYLVAGILIGMSFSSSSSSRKFPYLFIAAFLYQSKGLIVLPYALNFDAGQLYAPWTLAAFGSLALVLLVVVALGKPISMTVIRAAGVRTGVDRTSERKAQLLETVPQQIRGYSASAFAVLTLLYVVQPGARFYTDGAMILVGLVLVVVHVLSPNFIANFLRYRMFMDQTNWVSHFTVSTPFHKEIFGRTLPKNYRGGGITWTPRFLMRTVPVTVVVYVGALLMFIAATVDRIISSQLTPTSGTLIMISLIGVSLLPVLVAEISRSLQVGKAYFPAYLGLLVMIGAGASSLMHAAGDNDWARGILFFGAAALILSQIGITVRALANDVIPARMGPSRLYNFLKSRTIKSFYTYNTPFNYGFVETMLYSHPGEFEVTYVGNIEEANGGIFVVPPTSSKSVEMESDKYGLENGDFRADPVLAELLDSKRIEQVSMARLESRGTSRYYVHESEVTSYRDIFLNQISDHDRWLSHGWVVSTRKLDSGA